MDYSKQYFGKSINSLTFEDIEDFFSNDIEESDKLECKSYQNNSQGKIIFNKAIEGIIRGICGLLNSNGGILIWGAPQENIDTEGKKIFKGSLSPVTERKEKDQIISKISDSITPLPVGINLEILEKENKFIYIFEVKESQYSPHQYKNTYWARLDGQTKPAPHYLIEALFKKIKFPNLEGFVNFDDFGNQNVPLRNSRNLGLVRIDLSVLLFNFSEFQNESGVIVRLITDIGTFGGYSDPIAPKVGYLNEGKEYRTNYNIIHFGEPKFFNESIIFSLRELQEKGNKIEIQLVFGGNSTPLKSSTYTLDLSGTIHPDYLYRHITSKEENMLVSEKQELLGYNKSKTLQKLLKR